MLVDTHAHVNFRSFKDDALETVQRALDAGVWVVNVGTQQDTSRQAVEMAEAFEKGVYAIVGLHPEHTHTHHVDEEETHFKTREERFDTAAYRNLAEHPKVVGIGECGLDYYRLPEGGDAEAIKQKQKEAFAAQARLARELNKALVIHSRPEKGSESLYDELLEILDRESSTTPSPFAEATGDTPPILGGDWVQSSPNVGEVPRAVAEGGKGIRFVVHSFTGSPEALQKFLDRGGYVSFNGIITFDRTGNMEQLLKMTPLDRIVLETDSPYLTPVPNRGKRNEPAYVMYVAQKVAEAKGLSAEEVALVTTENATRLFGLEI